MPLSSYALDNFVAQDLSGLTECRAAEVAPEFPAYDSWLSSFVLTRIFRIDLPQGKAALFFALIRHAESAIADYEEARGHLSALVRDRKSISLYFRCLRRFESTLAMTYQALNLLRKAAGIKLFEKGDGSPYARANLIYRRVRHADPQALPPGHLHPVWLRNEGLFTDSASLTFDELADLVRQISRIADKLAKGEPPPSRRIAGAR
jgi:hypothetical protein